MTHGIRIAAKIGATLGALLVAFLVLVNVLLNTRLLPYAILGDDQNFAMSWRFAYSLWPTRLHVYDFRLTGQDPNIQLEYDQARADLKIDLSSLLHRTFRATSVRGVGSRFLMRERINPSEVDPENASVLPPIAGFSNPPLRFIGPEAAPTPDAVLEKELTARFEDVDVSVSELWIDGFRFQGQGQAFGSFHIKPQIDVAVDGHFELGYGAVTRGSVPVTDDLAGSLAVFVHQFDPRLHKGKDAVHSVDASLQVSGGLADLRVFTPCFDTGGVLFHSAPGRFELIGRFEGGRIVPHTWLRLHSELLSLAKGPFELAGPFEVTVQVEQVATASPLALAQVRLGPSRLLIADLARPLLQVGSLQLGASTATLDMLDEPFGDVGLFAQIDDGEVPDLSLLQEYLPGARAVAIRGGSARFNGALLSPATGPGFAEAHLDAEDLDLVLGPLGLRGSLLLGAVFQGVTPDARLTDLMGPNLYTAGASIDGHFAVRPRGAAHDITAAGHPLALTADARLAPFGPSEASVPYLLDRLSGRAQLDAELSGLKFLNGWSRIPAGWSFEGGHGSLAVDARVESGRLAAGSHLYARLANWGIEKNLIRAQGSLKLAASVARKRGKGGLLATLSVAPYTIELKKQKTLLLRGSRLDVVADSPSLALRHLASDLGLSGAAEAEVPDLNVYNQFLGPDGGFAIAAGSGQLSGSMHARKGGTAEGEMHVSGKRVVVDLQGRHLTADWDARTRLQQSHMPDGAVALTGGSVRLDAVSLDGSSEGWWSHIEMGGELTLGAEKRLRLQFGVKARDIAPILSLYGSSIGVSGWLQSSVSMSGFEATGRLEVTQDQFVIEDFRGTGRQLEVSGQFKLQGAEKWGDVVIGSGPLALGFEVRNKDTSVKVFNARGWYDNRLKQGLQAERPPPPATPPN